MNDKIFIVCVEINKQSLRDKFEHTAIGKGLPKRIMDNVYAVTAPYSFGSEQIRNQINSLFANSCLVFVMKASVDASWRLPLDIDSWLKDNI